MDKLIFFQIAVIILLLFKISKINNFKKNCFIDKIFIFIFILLLFIPTLKIDLSEINSKENRINAKLIKITDLEEWINSRFCLRDFLITTNHEILYNLAFRYPHFYGRIVDKKTKFLNRYPNPPIYKENLNNYDDFLEGIQQGLINFIYFCKQNSIKLYILILPEKETIYHPSIIINNNDQKVLQFIDEINGPLDLKIIFPYKQLTDEALKGKYMYYKTDHHLTNEGYYIVYNELLKNIQKDYPEINIVPEDRFKIFLSNGLNIYSSNRFYGSICNVINLPDYICENHLDVEYKYYIHKDYKNLKTKEFRDDYIIKKDFYYDKAPNIKLLLTGNSNIEDLSIFLPYSFRYMKKIRLNGPKGIDRKEQYKILKYYKNQILEYKPDIIVLCVGYDVIKELSKIDD